MSLAMPRQPDGEDGAEEREGHGQDDAQGQGPAFVLSGQDQEDHDDSEDERQKEDAPPSSARRPRRSRRGSSRR